MLLKKVQKYRVRTLENYAETFCEEILKSLAESCKISSLEEFSMIHYYGSAIFSATAISHLVDFLKASRSTFRKLHIESAYFNRMNDLIHLVSSCENLEELKLIGCCLLQREEDRTVDVSQCRKPLLPTKLKKLDLEYSEDLQLLKEVVLSE